MPIRIVLIDDDQTMHETIAALLRTNPGVSLVGEVFRGEDAVKLCRVTTPDLALMDVMLPGMSGMEATCLLHQQFPSLKILALSSFREYEQIQQMLDSGALGYLLKDTMTEELVDTIRATYHGASVFSKEAARIIRSTTCKTTFDLTDREMEVLRLMAEGLSDNEAAARLGVSYVTIRFHFKNILHKMGVDTRAQALVLAAKNNLV